MCALGTGVQTCALPIALLDDLESRGKQALALYDEPDAGLWEYRGRKHVHTFSSVLCWAALDRLARISKQMGIEDKATYWRAEADRIHREICRFAWDPERNSFRASTGEAGADAALLLLPDIGFVPASDPRFLGTLAAIEKERSEEHTSELQSLMRISYAVFCL